MRDRAGGEVVGSRPQMPRSSSPAPFVMCFMLTPSFESNWPSLAGKSYTWHNTTMAPSIQQMARRLEQVEKELVEVKADLAGKHNLPWYRRIVGDYTQDRA